MRFLLIILLALPFSAYAADQRVEIPVGDSPVRGPADAPVTMVEFIDFQ